MIIKNELFIFCWKNKKMTLHLYLLGRINEYLTVSESNSLIETGGAGLDFSDYNTFQMEKKLVKEKNEIKGIIYNYLNEEDNIRFEDILNIKGFNIISRYKDHHSDDHEVYVFELQLYRYKDFFIIYKVQSSGGWNDGVEFYSIEPYYSDDEDAEESKVENIKTFISSYITIVHKKDFDKNKFFSIPGEKTYGGYKKDIFDEIHDGNGMKFMIEYFKTMYPEDSIEKFQEYMMKIYKKN